MFSLITNDLLILVLSKLSVHEVISVCSFINKRFKNIIRNDSCWYSRKANVVKKMPESEKLMFSVADDKLWTIFAQYFIAPNLKKHVHKAVLSRNIQIDLLEKLKCVLFLYLRNTYLQKIYNISVSIPKKRMTRGNEYLCMRADISKKQNILVNMHRKNLVVIKFNNCVIIETESTMRAVEYTKIVELALSN